MTSFRKDLRNDEETDLQNKIEALTGHRTLAVRMMEDSLRFISGAVRWTGISRLKLDEHDTTTRDGLELVEEEGRNLFDALNKTLNKVTPRRRSRYEQGEEVFESTASPTELELLCDTLDRIGAHYTLVNDRLIAHHIFLDGNEACQSVPEYARVYDLDGQTANRVQTMVELHDDLAYFFDTAGSFIGQALYEGEQFMPRQKPTVP